MFFVILYILLKTRTAVYGCTGVGVRVHVYIYLFTGLRLPGSVLGYISAYRTPVLYYV